MRNYCQITKRALLTAIAVFVLQSTGSAALTAILTFDPVRSEMTFEVAWDQPLIQVELTGVGTIPTDPLTGLRTGERLVWNGYSANGLLGQDIGDYVVSLFNADILIDNFHGVSTSQPNFGLFIDDDGGIDDDFYLAVIDGTPVPGSGSFELTAAAPAAGFSTVFNYGTFVGGDTTLAIRQIPEPSSGALFGLALLLGARSRHSRNGRTRRRS